jgi:hypothetical protein
MSHSAHGESHGPSAESLAAGHELSDARARPLVIAGVVLFALIIVSFALTAALVVVAGSGVGDTSNVIDPAQAQEQLPPAPRLEQNPRVDGDRIISQATERLESYGWVDKRAGTAHIPIERAIELVLEKGVGGQ